MKIGMRHLHLFILLFAASSLLFQLPPEVFASTPSDITAKDAVTDGDTDSNGNTFDALRYAKAVSTFVIGSSTYAIVTSIDGVQIIDISDPTDILATDTATDGTDGFECLAKISLLIL